MTPSMLPPSVRAEGSTDRSARRPFRTPGRLVKALAGAVLAVTTLAGLTAGSATAQTTVSSPYRGGVTFNVVGGQYVGSTGAGLRISGPFVTRSLASNDTQIVYFQAIVEQFWGDRWVTVWNSGLRGTFLSPGHPGRYLDPYYAAVGSGAFR